MTEATTVAAIAQPSPAASATPAPPEKVKNQYTAWIEHKSEDGKTLSGDFTFKRPTLVEVGQIGSMIARLNGGNAVDETTDLINTMLSHFRYTIVKAPTWWDMDTIYEIGLARKVYGELMKFLSTFRSAEVEQGA